MKTLAIIIAFLMWSALAVLLMGSIALATPFAWVIERKWFELCQLLAWLLVLVALVGGVMQFCQTFF